MTDLFDDSNELLRSYYQRKIAEEYPDHEGAFTLYPTNRGVVVVAPDDRDEFEVPEATEDDLEEFLERG
jgi:hypothetical protein